jgi:O-antigen ligase
MFERRSLERGLPALGVAGATVYLSFNAGGFFAGAPALLAAVLGVALTVRIVVAEQPFAGIGPWLGVAIGALGLFAVWTLASAWWSHAPARAMISFDRLLLYWLALVLFGSLPRDARTLRWALRAFAAAVVAVAVAGLATRLLPDVWSAPASVQNHRLSYPLTYWNSLGILVGVGIVLCTHLAAAADRSRLTKVLAAGALPLLAATLYFTFSRGSIATVLLGLLVYAALARPKGLVSVALAAVPTVLVALVVCYGADLLATGHYASSPGVVEGHRVAAAVLVCALIAALVRLALCAALDPRLERVHVSPATRRRTLTVAVPVALLAIVVAAIVVDLPHLLDTQYERFTADTGASSSGDLRNRLTSVSNNGRLSQWRVALDDGFSPHPLDGTGAGTFAELWSEHGVAGLKVENAHSLYVEVLAELGVPGLLMLLTAIVALLGGLASALRGPERQLQAALLAAAVAWLVHAGFDWDWQMPATIIWLFGLGGMAIARPAGQPARELGRFPRVALGIGCLVLIVTPVLMALSQARLDSAVAALERGDCGAATSDALAAAHLVSPRPEPYQLLGFCDSRAGQHELAVRMLETAVDKDPKSWESFYGLALVTGAAGRDPRPAARRAFELAPHEPLARNAVARFRSNDPEVWRRRASTARLPLF